MSNENVTPDLDAIVAAAVAKAIAALQQVPQVPQAPQVPQVPQVPQDERPAGIYPDPRKDANCVANLLRGDKAAVKRAIAKITKDGQIKLNPNDLEVVDLIGGESDTARDMVAQAIMGAKKPTLIRLEKGLVYSGKVRLVINRLNMGAARYMGQNVPTEYKAYHVNGKTLVFADRGNKQFIVLP